MSEHNDNLVTLAIHTFEKAQILKTRLESEGIETVINNVNLVQPNVSAGVRVRIKESDLPKALSIVEKMNLGSKEDYAQIDGAVQTAKRVILVPIDFSDYSIKACDTAFFMANRLGAEVVVMNAYFTPMYNNVPIFDVVTYKKAEDTAVKLLDKAKVDMSNITNLINKKIASGSIPNVKFSTIIKEGIPEEEIGKVCDEIRPIIIVMGTRGKDRKEQDLIGSVTAEIIERSSAPILAIPEDEVFEKFADVKNIAYATNFGPNDLLAFDKMINMLKPYSFKVYLVHIQRNTDAWNEIKLAGIQEYFKKQYPNLETEYALIKDSNILEGLDKFVEEKNIDVISLNSYKRNIFSRLFNPSIARKMVFHAQTPMLIMHS